MMFLGSFREFEVGQRYEVSIVDADRQVHYNVPVLVLREATEQEWRDWCKETGQQGVEPVGSPSLHGARFYAVSTD
jgi:hypothetical protein